MKNEVSVNARTLLQTEDKVLALELMAERVRVMLCDVSDYLTETQDDYLVFCKEPNRIKANIALDCICELEEEIKVLKTQIQELRYGDVKEDKKCA